MMLEQKTTDFLEVLSSAAPVPGGGGASAAVGAFASALGMMVANLTIGKKKYADVEAEIIERKERLLVLQKKLIELTDKDAEAFEPLSKAYGLPKETKEQIEEKERVMEKALYEASIVPLEIMKTVSEVMDELKALGEKGSRIAISDVGVAVLFARAALEGASLNIYINTRLMKDREQAERLNRESDHMITEVRKLQEEIYAGVLEKIR
ncbi:cyclodeaminase/cyclohydrolase family protein [Dorea acetigenes]|jgi:formiminotetrahydrofolate cyclodeaminase|uniref:Cyclodeaminase/cyclohydrolase family protein n=1 Tax=Dorea acetigenes TaxID=2981787 RepID=A0ABT2RKH2_9FIRM|nr:cyclodeaminase/cyclohydrolase family protein [Dorea acetigenes]MCB6414913.1 cyclodeaminase/cyclohydrolase family protein [Faecalimonas umbilicata]MCU6685908.1 cyclodeaminase/cyclohydrolase family protein [Dorea acetigenes]SCI69958.1 Methenyltetrahydrofolate cyclohydrolase [uncultured Clostridium sp.]